MDKPKHRRVVLKSNGSRNRITPSDEHTRSYEDLIPRTHFDGLPAPPSPVLTWQPNDVLLSSTPGRSTLSNTTPRGPNTVQTSAWERRGSSSSSGNSDEVFVPRMASSVPMPLRAGEAERAALSLERRSARSRRKTSASDKHTPPPPARSRANAPSTPNSLQSTVTDGSLNSSLHMPLLTSSLRKGGSKPSVGTQWERGGIEEMEVYFPDHQVRIFTATWNMHEERV